jgi:quercetin 2,3-dioxygenase
MTAFRKLQSIHTAPETQMGQITIRQAFPLQGLEQVSPFILLHHFDLDLKPGDNRFNVPPHPHRGFSPVTYMFEGAVEHQDSLGNKQVIGSNEVQWINAGRGIIHGEKADAAFVDKGGRYQGIQLWINVPRAEKMNPPYYQAIMEKDIELVEKEGTEFRLISGSYQGKKGPAPSKVFTAMLRMQPGSNLEINLPVEENSALYVLEGDLTLNGFIDLKRYDLAVFKNEEGLVKLEAKTASKLLLMSGEAIREPLVTHGPFVMTTQTEILEAMRDYQQGKMGFLY